MTNWNPMSRLGYGCYALGGAYGSRLDSAQAVSLIRQAYDLGIRFFDTADQYGSEEVLGKAVKPFRAQVAIATKVGAAPGGLSRNNILACCAASLKRLDTEYIDLYQIHYDDPAIPASEIAGSMEILKAQGKIRHFGVGHLPLDKTRDFLKTGEVKTVLAEMNAAALNRYAELRPLQEHFNFGIIAFSVTGRGMLTGGIHSKSRFADSDIRSHDPFFRRSKLASGLRIAAKFQEIGRRYGVTPAQLSIAWVLNAPGVAAALTGPTDPAHLKENCRALDIALTASCYVEIDSFLREEAEIVQKAVHEEIMVIISNPLHPDWKTAVDDLTYVLEHSIEDGMIPYAEGVNLYVRLIKAKQSLQPDFELINNCQQDIKALLTA